MLEVLGRADIDWKFSPCLGSGEPFDTFFARETPFLLGSRENAPQYQPDKTACHLNPQEFHKKLSDKKERENTALIDVRNMYEYRVGRFPGAINPKTRKYTEFDDWFRREGAAIVEGKDNVLMYCTGGIRCEKASLVVQEVLKEKMEEDKLPRVYQLQGGIHRYLEAFEPKESLFEGDNFVFDKRTVQCVSNQTNSNLEDSTTVVGQCYYCSVKWDQIRDDRRCTKCRMLVLACDKCANSQPVWCELHSAYDPRKRTQKEVALKLDELKKRLADVGNGRRQQKKRSKLRKQLLELQSEVE